MTVANIVDRRTNKYDVHVDVVFEPSFHDNHVPGATQFLKEEKSIVVAELVKTTIEYAIKYAEKWNYAVTVYLYNYDSNPLGELKHQSENYHDK